MHYTKSTVMSI